MKIDDDEKGLGKKLIDVFCRQLGGTYYFQNQNGVTFNLLFALQKIHDKDAD
ncbi:MAG: hypothetical protein ACOVO1_13200 [Chitinophagaceae bacterium]